jgi:hypothetical protein
MVIIKILNYIENSIRKKKKEGIKRKERSRETKITWREKWKIKKKDDGT